ncbi:magnesium transporter [Leucosporidium creatinivorum]|uniref:Magnesium transporter n=1 Tax=Leucosporidium creatinivorum TaxID=106004 RepID=A0A1Y2EMZ9_9BASI|nr:magnesium transporter [Leucosporidium creatinivorum]
MVSWPTPAAILIRLAALVFLHAAYSAWEVRGLAKTAGVEIPSTLGSPLPVDIIAQAFISFILLATGVIWSATPLKKISWASEMSKRCIDSEDSRLSFANVRHRGSVLFAETD